MSDSRGLVALHRALILERVDFVLTLGAP